MPSSIPAQGASDLEDVIVPKFVTIGYGDEEGYARTEAAVREAAHAHDAELQGQGVVMGRAGRPVQVRNPDAARVGTAEGSFMTSALPLMGFAIIEAASLSDAIALVAQSPCAVAHGVVEVWPLDDAAGGAPSGA
ncbi:YciI family protein [Rubellimicrobium arenae]|uniref:YciI family protein n=1 Tax=Rubellimicrobium arenae TaxID=2817372 RepID=UPI001B31155D|nr:YciI family protein [Rubellimicrobium arenae]